MPEQNREPTRGDRPTRLRLALGAAFLAVVGTLAWLVPRRRAAAPAIDAARARAASIARLRRTGHEPIDIAVAPIVATGLLLILLVSASQLALWGFFRASIRSGAAPSPAAALLPVEAPVQRPAGLPTATTPALPARLPVRPGDRQQLQAQDEQRLHSYGWIDRPGGVVHIPIDRALDLIVERGLPTREGR